MITYAFRDKKKSTPALELVGDAVADARLYGLTQLDVFDLYKRASTLRHPVYTHRFRQFVMTIERKDSALKCTNIYRLASPTEPLRDGPSTPLRVPPKQVQPMRANVPDAALKPGEFYIWEECEPCHGRGCEQCNEQGEIKVLRREKPLSRA